MTKSKPKITPKLRDPDQWARAAALAQKKATKGVIGGAGSAKKP
jgi:hypothetical protein